MSNRIHYYFGAVVGAYAAIWFNLKWWSPLLWIVIFIIIEAITALLALHSRRKEDREYDN